MASNQTLEGHVKALQVQIDHIYLKIDVVSVPPQIKGRASLRPVSKLKRCQRERLIFAGGVW